jgi:hypothetical protein
MTVKRFSRREFTASLATTIAIGPAAMAAERRRTRRKKIDPKDIRTVEFFEAKKKGDIKVDFIPKDATVATLIIKNKTDKPLSIKLPVSFAGVPVLAQGMMGGGGGMMGGGGGFFNVAPDKVGKIKLPCVCLEHGKPDPTPRMKYDIVPLESFTKDPKVAEICKMLGYREVPQNAAQAAAWHLTDGMSWQQLARKNRVESKYTGNIRFFNYNELHLAVRIAGEATRRAKDIKPTIKSPGEQTYQTGQSQTGGG